MAETFGAALRRFRTSAGLTQERLAERSEISAAGVAALKAGRGKMPRLNTDGLLCDGACLNTAAHSMSSHMCSNEFRPFRPNFALRFMPFGLQSP